MENLFKGGMLRLEEPRFSLEFNERCEVYTVRDSVWKATGLEPYRESELAKTPVGDARNLTICREVHRVQL